MIIRTETTADFEEVFKLHYLAFGNREDESRLIERIRVSEGFVSELSVVAELNNEIIGHLLLSKASVEEKEKTHSVIVLAPIAVKPSCQKQGIGSSLIKEGFERCKKLGYNSIFLIGHPSYYPKFGFQPARKLGFELSQFNVPDEVFMVCELKEGALQNIKGELKYPNSFFG
jgi:putative acetyltransferase